MPLEALFDWGGEQMSLFLGKDLGDLLTISLNKYVHVVCGVYRLRAEYTVHSSVEAALAIILLTKCE